MRVEVVYALADKQTILEVDIPDNTTISQALKISGILELYPELTNSSVGIFGKLRSREWILTAGDRVEIYRPLVQDPKTARHKRAKQQKAKRAKNKTKN